MQLLLHVIVVTVVTAVSLMIITKLPLGVEIDSFNTALITAIVLGILNALLNPILQLLALPLTVLTLGLFALVVNAVVFNLAARVVDGFEIEGALGALLSPIVLSILNTLIFALLPASLAAA